MAKSVSGGVIVVIFLDCWSTSASLLVAAIMNRGPPRLKHPAGLGDGLSSLSKQGGLSCHGEDRHDVDVLEIQNDAQGLAGGLSF